MSIAPQPANRFQLPAVNWCTLLLPLMACGALLAAPSPRTQTDVGTTASQATALISVRCMKCHNTQLKAGGFDFAMRAHALVVLRLGANGSSRMVRAVSTGKMPPTGRLSAAEVAVLKRWDAQGATYPHEPLSPPATVIRPPWSYYPVARRTVPHTRFDSLAVNPIDRFIFFNLQQHGLRPNYPATRPDLIRRVTFDLTGLPPSPTEIAAFCADKSQNAYSRLVGRLLASPAYGERWGRHWLDVVRFGESNGYEQNLLRTDAWPYRDYVINALNADIPYTNFVEQQLAGDYLVTAPGSSGTAASCAANKLFAASLGPKGNAYVSAATGFLVAGIHDTVASPDIYLTRQQRSNDLDDMVSTTADAFLGLTVGCAKCHDHKFDPIPQVDFYRLEACFAGVHHGERQLPDSASKVDDQLTMLHVDAQIFEATNKLNRMDLQARHEIQTREKPAPERTAVNARRNEDWFTTVTARFIRFTVNKTNDGTEPCLDELQIYAPYGSGDLALASKGAKATASSLFPNAAIHQIGHLNDGLFGNDHSWISGAKNTGWAQIELPAPTTINLVVWSRDGAPAPRFDDRLPTEYRIDVSLDGRTWHTVSSNAGRGGSTGYIHPDDLRKAMSEADRAWRDQLSTRVTQLTQQRDTLGLPGMAYAGTFTAPEPTYLLRRGDVMQRLEEVTPAGLSQIRTLPAALPLSSGASDPERRLALAHWITDPRNPLTPRVIVNRVWQYHFGEGIVPTSSDFGANGERPTNLPLLDWLASALSENPPTAGGSSYACGWRLKRLHKMIVSSYTYRQSSAVSIPAMAKDSGDRLLWRMPLRRLEAEAIRDSILAVSGKLNRTMGGPGFELYNYTVLNVAAFKPLEQYGSQTWRRAVYQQAARGIRDDLLGAFDCPESAQRAPRRPSTTTPLQALSLLNGPFIMQQSHFYAQRVRAEAGLDVVRQVRAAFMLAFGRAPSAGEAAAAANLVRYSGGLDTLCRALYNANEFLYY